MRFLSHRNKIIALSLITASALPFAAQANNHLLSPQKIEIKRDNYGVPHVFADTHYGLFYGYGYSVAQDRMFQLDMARRSFIGTTAEVLGAGENNVYLNYDIQVRQNFNPESIRKQITALSKDDHDIFKGYADGFNAYLKKVESNPELLPKEYSDFGFMPSALSDFDVVMIWVGSMANRFSDTNLEINALGLLQDLELQHGKEIAKKIFDELRWINDPDSPTTVSKGTSQAHTSSAMEVALKPVSTQLIAQNNQQQLTTWGGIGPDFAPKASNLWSTQPHRVKENATMLINGPQFGWYNPSYTYGIGLHGAGFDAIGNTPFAYPIILFGTNGTTAWGATAGPQDVVDMYQEQLDPTRPNYYLFNGQYRAMTERKERIQVKNQADTIITVQSTVHGLVSQVDTKNNIAYSKKRSWDGYEVQSLLAWVNVAKAKDWTEFLAQAEKMAISINWYYADKNGNIGYVSPGFLPKRPANQDIRIPAIGDGSMEWEGIYDFNATPKAYNPAQGYLSNWNNRPGPDKTNTDTYFWSYGDRVNELNSQYDQKEKFSLAELWDFNKVASYQDVNWRYFKPHLEAMHAQLSPEHEAYNTLALLLSWNGAETNDHGKNTHSGRLIFKTWLEEMYKLTLNPIVPSAHQAAYTQTGFMSSTGQNPGSTNLSMGTKVILRALALEQNPDPARFNVFGEQGSMKTMQTALHNAHQRLITEYGNDTAQWKLPTSIKLFSSKNFTGTPQTSPENTFQITGYQNRGTENNRIVFQGNAVEFCDAMPPGQSGFIDQQGKRSPHYDDQLQMYENFECKSVAFDKSEIDRNTTEHTTLLIQR